MAACAADGSTSLTAAELDRLKALLRDCPQVTASDRGELVRLYQRAGATDLLMLMQDPGLARKLKRLAHPADFQWDRMLAWGATLVAALLVAWLCLQTAI